MLFTLIIRFRFLSKIILLALAPFVFSCGGNPVDDDAPAGPASLSVVPAHAAPGVTLAVSGAVVDTSDLDSYRLLIGGQQTVFIADTLGRVTGIAPALFTDSTVTWPSPAGGLDIELFRDTTLIGVGVGIFTSDSLIQVPGSTQELVTNVIETVESYKTILGALPTGPGIQEQLTVAIITALDSLLYGRGDSSLSALLVNLQANNPEALALLDATYATDGSTARSQEIADAMAAIAASFGSGSFRRGQVLPADVRLAAQMQLSSLLKLFGDSFIHGASGTASDIAFGASWARYAGFIPGAQLVIVFASVTSTVLSMVDLIFNKIIVASMPTVIDSLTITLAADTISVGDTTITSLKIYARNSPPQITLSDLLSQFSGIMGLLSPGGAPTLLEQLEGTLAYVLGQVNSALQAYAAAHPDFSYEPIFFDITGVPIMHWEAEINDPRLLNLTALSSKLSEIDSLLEWSSTGDVGSASITISPSFDASATLIPIPPFLGYVGSSFGVLSDSSALISRSEEVFIEKDLVLLVDFAPTISRDGANVLGVRAGDIGIGGDTVWQAGFGVSLLAVGGGADPDSGTTDATGQFNSLVSLDPFSDTVEVVVTVTRSSGGFARDTVMAVLDSAVVQDTIPRIAFLSKRDGVYAFWTMMPFDTSTVKKIRNSGSRSPINLRWAPGFTMFSYTDINFNGLEAYFVNTSGSRRRIGSDLHFRSTTAIPWALTDSSLLVYSAELSGGLPKIFTENPFTNVRDTLYSDALGIVGLPRLSPNGQFIVFYGNTPGGSRTSFSIYRGDVDGSNVIRLADLTDSSGIVEMAWSSDGSDIIYNYVSPSQTPRIVRKVSASGGAVVTLGSYGTVSSLHTIPGTRKVVYAAGPTFPGVTVKEGIFVQNIDDLSFEILPNTAINVTSIGVSPDGKYVCYDDGTSGTGRNIYMIELATGNRTQLTADGISFRVTWSRW